MEEIELDLPLAERGVTRFTQWIVAAATCLAVLAMAVAAVADAELRRAALRPVVLTLALPAGTPAGEVEAVLRLLRESEGVALAERVEAAELTQLVEPWLGDLEGTAELDMPQLIDVTFDPGFVPDPEALAARLRTRVPDASLGDAVRPETAALETARNLRLLALIAAVSFVLAGVAAVAAVVRSSLLAQAETVDLLRLMGAAGRYVERQFEEHTLRSGLRGGIGGFLAAALAILAGVEFGRRFGLSPLDALVLRPLDWLLLAAVPVVLVLLAAAAVRLVVGRRAVGPA